MPRITPACVMAGDVSVGDMDALGDEPAGDSMRLCQSEVEDLHGPVRRTLMFAGFRSRWMIPCSCAASSASAICFAIGSASSTGSRHARGVATDRRPRRVP